jgi:hypothetical protein
MIFSAYADSSDDAVWVRDTIRAVDANTTVAVQRVDIMPPDIRAAVENNMPRPTIYPAIQLVQPCQGPEFIQGRDAITQHYQT